MTEHIGAAMIVQGTGPYRGYVLFVREGGSDTTTGKEANMVSLPAGHCEIGELASGTAKREVREETGLAVNVIRELGFYRGTNTQGHVFIGEIDPVVPRGPIGDDISGTFWAYPHEVLAGAFGELRPQMRRPLEDYLSQNS